MSLFQGWRVRLGSKVVSPLPSSSLKAEVLHVPGMAGVGLLQKKTPPESAHAHGPDHEALCRCPGLIQL